VDCCRSITDDGYATAAALVLSLALAMVVTGVTLRGAQTLKLARLDLDRLEAERDLAGAQLVAAAAIVRSGREPPYHWTFSTDEGWIDVRAELESEKLSLEGARALRDDAFQKLGVTDAGQLKQKLKTTPAGISLRDLAGLDGAKAWRDCANSLISPRGGASEWRPVTVAEPGAADGPPTWRVGETWRIRTATKAGWRDERVVRFTGDARNPAATIERWFSRGEGDGGTCDRLMNEDFAPSREMTATP